MVTQDKGFTSRATEVLVTSGEVMKHAPCGVLRGLGPIATQVRCRRAYRRACGLAVVGVPLAGARIAAILGLGLHVNLSPSAPRGLYRAVTGTPLGGAWVAACVSRSEERRVGEEGRSRWSPYH